MCRCAADGALGGCWEAQLGRSRGVAMPTSAVAVAAMHGPDLGISHCVRAVDTNGLANAEPPQTPVQIWRRADVGPSLFRCRGLVPKLVQETKVPCSRKTEQTRGEHRRIGYRCGARWDNLGRRDIEQTLRCRSVENISSGGALARRLSFVTGQSGCRVNIATARASLVRGLGWGDSSRRRSRRTGKSH